MIRTLGRLSAIPLAALCVACGATDDQAGVDPGSMRPEAAPGAASEPPTGGFSEPARCETLDELVIAADTIVVGEVTKIERAAAEGEGEARFEPNRIRLAVQEVLKGAPHESISFLSDGFNARGEPVHIEGVPRNKVGDRGIYFLSASGDPSAEESTNILTNPQGRFFRNGEDVEPGHRRDDGLSREQSEKSFSELRQDILDAVNRTKGIDPGPGYYCGREG